MNFYYHLQKYRGPSSRHECPKCKDKHSFTYYVDPNDNILDVKVGKCNHQSSCGYHFSPSDYFKLNPDARTSRTDYTAPLPKVVKPLCYIPYEYVSKSKSTNNMLFQYLGTIFPSDKLQQVANDYLIGSTKAHDIIYWQIDHTGKVRTGKVMSYTSDGHRDKTKPYGANWIHSILIKQHKLPCDWQLTQCLFGEHLLRKYPDKPVGIVEAEKTAIIASLVAPNFLWVSCGGVGNLNSVVNILSNRSVMVFPDLDGYDNWQEKVKHLSFKVTVSHTLQQYDDGTAPTMDIADIILKQYLSATKTTGNKLLDSLIVRNPEVEKLISDLDLQFISEVPMPSL